MTVHEHVLITGAAGFSGRHLAQRLRDEGNRRLFGLDLPADTRAPVDEYFRCDLTEGRAVADAVLHVRPDKVYHLAGRIGVGSDEEMQRVNVGGFRSLRQALWECVQATRRPIRVVVVGSAAELGSEGASRLPVGEDAPCMPESPYGRSKWEVTRLALAEPPNGPLSIIVARPFNLVGPGLSDQLSLGSFARQVVAAWRGKADAIHCGRLDTRRDYVDVRDAVNAYVLLADDARPGLYNVCAGCSYPVAELLRTLIELTGREIPVASDTSQVRPGDLLDIYGDHSKITREVGWQPTFPIRESLADMLAAVSSERPSTTPLA